MLPLSPEPMRSSTGNSIESVEQPCGVTEEQRLELGQSSEWRQVANPRVTQDQGH